MPGDDTSMRSFVLLLCCVVLVLLVGFYLWLRPLFGGSVTGMAITNVESGVFARHPVMSFVLLVGTVIVLFTMILSSHRRQSGYL